MMLRRRTSSKGHCSPQIVRMASWNAVAEVLAEATIVFGKPLGHLHARSPTRRYARGLTRPYMTALATACWRFEAPSFLITEVR